MRHNRYNLATRMRFHPGILALFLTPPGLPSGGFHWQRTITPPLGAPLAQACVILDAQTFANAAPALRDLRLFQNGVELPYAVEESYDPRALETGVTTADDRSLYETSLVANLNLQPSQTSSGGSTPRSYGQVDIPAHVPVERVRLEPAPNAPVLLDISATENNAVKRPAPAERVSGMLDAQHPGLPFTLGVNLQHHAHVQVVAEHGVEIPRRAIFEMRRRSLCYQPRSASPLTLYLGGGEAMTAKTYSYASNFSTALDRPYATVGPLIPNPDVATTPSVSGLLTARKRMLLAAAIAAVFFFVAARAMLRPTKSPA